MNHRPFEDWLLEDRPLSGQEQRELQLHLRTCRSCAAIAESNLALHSTHWASPPPGFADRFNRRLASWRARQRWYQLFGTLVLVIGGLAILYAVMESVVQQALQSPADWITAATVYLVFAVESLQVLNEVGRILLRDLPGFVSPESWLVMSVGGTGLALAAAVSVRHLIRARQGV
jgi:hypothetical protein